MIERSTNGTCEEEARSLVETVYDELRRLAHRQMAERSGPGTLQTTALVHEAWLRLQREGRATWASRAQFFVAAATAMRRILVDRARFRGRLKREGSHTRVAWSEVEASSAPTPTPTGAPTADTDDRFDRNEARALLELDLALDDLRAFDARLARIVELRAFGGLTEAETGSALGLSERSIRRDWRAARLWLYRRVVELQVQPKGDAPHAV